MNRSLQDIKGFLVDLDGTTYLGDTALPGAVDFFSHLTDQSIPYLFFSNNPTKSVNEYTQRIAALDIPVQEKQIITSTLATIHYCQQQGFTTVYAIGTEFFIHELEQVGITISDTRPQAVIISFDTTVTYEKIQTVSRLLLEHPDIPYLATNPDIVCPTEDGPIPDCGAFIALFKAVTNREPLIMGKPEKGMVDLAQHHLQLPLHEIAVIGDRVYTDMEMGHTHGLLTVLVLSGETNKEEIDALHPQPHFVFENLLEILDHIK